MNAIQLANEVLTRTQNTRVGSKAMDVFRAYVKAQREMAVQPVAEATCALLGEITGRAEYPLSLILDLHELDVNFSYPLDGDLRAIGEAYLVEHDLTMEVMEPWRDRGYRRMG